MLQIGELDDEEWLQRLKGLTAEETMVVMNAEWEEIRASSNQLNKWSAERSKILQAALDANDLVMAENEVLKLKLHRTEEELQDLEAFVMEIGLQLISRGRRVPVDGERRAEGVTAAMDSGFESVTEPESDDDNNITFP